MNRGWLVVCTAAALFVLLFIPPVAQDEAFHRFADDRTITGIPNFWNVLSNLPFFAIGIAGLVKSGTTADRALFAGVLLTGFGSGFYHLAPSDARLVWDRLPMAIIFMAFTAIAMEWTEGLGLLLSFGVGSVVLWRFTGDLRLYGIAKFGPILLMLPALVSPTVWPLRKRQYILAVVSLFAIAQWFELENRLIAAALPLSLHTIKHLVAGLATWFLLQWRSAACGEPAVRVA